MGMREKASQNRGQMAVELAVFMPVVLALAIAAADLMTYLGDCVRFDRIAGTIVRLHAASPEAMRYGPSASIAAMQADITEAMGGSGRLEVSVSDKGSELLQDATSGEAVIGAFIPNPHIYECTLAVRPWPFEHGAFGIDVSLPLHTHRYAVDPYRPGALL